MSNAVTMHWVPTEVDKHLPAIGQQVLICYQPNQYTGETTYDIAFLVDSDYGPVWSTFLTTWGLEKVSHFAVILKPTFSIIIL